MSLSTFYHPIIRRPYINNQIRISPVRVVDETGKQLGVIDLTKALQISRERNLDLIQVTDKVSPPVCKIMDYGKYLYQAGKKEKTVKKGEIKGIRLRFNNSSHDLETKARQAEKFLKKGDKVKIQMVLRGREKALADFAREKVNQFLEILNKSVQIKIEREIKKDPRGFMMIISKQ